MRKGIMKKSNFILVMCIANIGLGLYSTVDAAGRNTPGVDAAFIYDIGGAEPIARAPAGTPNIVTLSAGIQWNNNMTCGSFDPQITVTNQLNGLTDGFRNMMGNILSAAQGFVAGLPAMAIQRANPGLYDLLQSGILQGKADFEFAETSCEEMNNMITGDGPVPFEKFTTTAKSNAWRREIQSTGGDAVQAKENVESSDPGDGGVTWVGGAQKGGAGQQPIESVKDTVIAGYNTLMGRSVTDNSVVPAAQGNGKPMWSYWNNPTSAGDYAVDVVGDWQWRICDGCTKAESVPGVGLVKQYENFITPIENDLNDLVSGSENPTWQNLQAVSAPPSLVISLPVIKALQEDRVGAAAITRLAGEIALTRAFEQGNILKRIITAGRKEPNIANAEEAQKQLDRALQDLNEDLDMLVEEMEMRKRISSNTLSKLLIRSEQRAQTGRQDNLIQSDGVDQAGRPN